MSRSKNSLMQFRNLRGGRTKTEKFKSKWCLQISLIGKAMMKIKGWKAALSPFLYPQTAYVSQDCTSWKNWLLASSHKGAFLSQYRRIIYR